MQQSVKTGKIYRQVNWELESLGSRSTKNAVSIQNTRSELGGHLSDIAELSLCSAETDQSLSALQELFE